MKKIMILAAVAAMVMVSACGTQKAVSETKKTSSAFGVTQEIPCAVYDTDEYFAATGIYMGSSRQKGECINNALENAKQQVYAKYHHSYQGMVSNYSSSYGDNRGNDIKTKLQRAGDAAINAVLNDIQACCTQFSEVYEDGMVECYVAIKVPKTVLVEKTAEIVKDVLTPEEKEAIDFEEFSFRKEMAERQKEFNEQK